jgi:hypothetical protein
MPIWTSGLKYCCCLVQVNCSMYFTKTVLKNSISTSLKTRFANPVCYLVTESCETHKCTVGFEVFTSVTMKSAVFWIVAPCSSERGLPADCRALQPLRWHPSETHCGGKMQSMLNFKAGDAYYTLNGWLCISYMEVTFCQKLKVFITMHRFSGQL